MSHLCFALKRNNSFQTYINADSAADCADSVGCCCGVVEAGVLSLDTGSSVFVVSVFVLKSKKKKILD